MEVVKEKLLTIWTLGVLSLEMIIKLGTMAYANIFYENIYDSWSIQLYFLFIERNCYDYFSDLFTLNSEIINSMDEDKWIKNV